MPLPLIEPIVPLLAREVPRGREWTYELKLDGFRGVFYADGGAGRFRSKRNRRLDRFRDLAGALARILPATNAILDGEVVVMAKEGPDFNALFFDRGPLLYVAFDLLWLNDRDLRELPLWRRKAMLAKLVRDTPIATVESTNDPRLFEAAADMDLEGIVAKRRSDPYAPDTEWLKIKHAGYTQKEGRWELFRDRRP